MGKLGDLWVGVKNCFENNSNADADDARANASSSSSKCCCVKHGRTESKCEVIEPKVVKVNRPDVSWVPKLTKMRHSLMQLRLAKTEDAGAEAKDGVKGDLSRGMCTRRRKRDF